MNTTIAATQGYYAGRGNITTAAGSIHMPHAPRISQYTCCYCGLQGDCYTAYDPAEDIEWDVCGDCLPAQPYIIL